MTGLDPAPAMIEMARRGAHAEQVQWMCGDASELGRPGADLAIMTGHVAQFFLTDESWSAALAVLHRALRPERWTRAVCRSADDPTAGRIDTWLDFTA